MITIRHIAAVALLLIVPHGAWAQGLPACRVDLKAQRDLKAFVLGYATAATTDTSLIEVRDSLRIPALVDSAVVVVTDSMKCASLRSAVATAAGRPDSTVSVVVIRAGTRYVGSDPTILSGEWTFGVIVDSTFTVLSAFGW